MAEKLQVRALVAAFKIAGDTAFAPPQIVEHAATALPQVNEFLFLTAKEPSSPAIINHGGPDHVALRNAFLDIARQNVASGNVDGAIAFATEIEQAAVAKNLIRLHLG